jgi:cytoskeletal protein RodZ
MPEALFKSKNVKIDTLGDYLKKIRAKLNMDIKTVSLLTQIKPGYLESLETGAYDKLPADVYIRGFLKNLSSLYHLDEQVLVEQFEKEHGFAEAHTKRAALNMPQVKFTPKTIILGISLFVFLAALVYVVSEIRSVLAPPKLEILEPASDITVEGNSIVILGVAEIGSDVSINDQAVLLDQNGQFNEHIILGSGLNQIQVTATNKFNKVSTLTRKVNAQIQSNQEPIPTLPVNITVQIGPNPAWVSIEVDGVVVQRGTMLPGSTKTFSAKEDVLLTSANAGSTTVIYNGKDLGKLGRDAEVIRNVEFSTRDMQL